MSNRKEFFDSPATRGAKEIIGGAARKTLKGLEVLFVPAFWKLSRNPEDWSNIKKWQGMRSGMHYFLTFIIGTALMPEDGWGSTLDFDHIYTAVMLAFTAGNVVDWAWIGLVKLGSKSPDGN